MRSGRLLVVVGVLSMLVGCATPGRRTVIAGAGGAMIGGGVGGAIGDTKGAAIGAGVGAVAGAALGNYLDKRAQEMEKVADTKKTERGLLVNLPNDLLFAFDSDVLGPTAVEQISKVGDVLAKYPEDRIRIEGHTDSRGTTAYNANLSERRADAVARVLRSRGVRESQMVIQGRGEAEPVASNGVTSGRAQNRRVELHVDVTAGAPQKVASRRN